MAADSPLASSAARAGVDVVATADVVSACVMAAITGDVTGSPGALAFDTQEDADRVRPALASALAERSPLICFGPLDERVDGAVKAIVDAGASSAAHWIAHALHLARSSPRGPVYVTASAGFSTPAVPVATNIEPVGLPAPDAESLDRAAAAIRSATHPVVVVGVDGRSDSASSWLRAFAEFVPAPVLATWKAKGALPDPHPLSFGIVGTSVPAASVMERADLVVAVGLDSFERDALAWNGTVIDIGPGPSTHPVSVSGDVGTVLAELAPRLRDTRSDWDVAQLDRWKRQLDVRHGKLDLVGVVAFVREAMPAGTIAAFESALGGAAVAWDCVAPEELHVLVRSELEGFAVPAAVAAALARPSDVALAFTDAGNLAAAAEALATATRAGAAVGIVVTGAQPITTTGAIVRAASEPALAAGLSRLLAQRRPLVIDATGMRAMPSV